ncbi:MAG TPA: hypothetical protein VL357_12175 [Rariglobus sp.]|jgi:hypothetical protein|nr:hypothetical protein [Rariglobus sp.]
MKSHRQALRGGFALLITITLLAFLVLILVSLAALTRVETQVADNQKKLEQARQNALMALNIAIGQLQKYAGPDARMTARAEITSTVAVTNPYFTGVWDAAGSSASPLVWLVSGCENTDTTPAQLLSGAPDPSSDTVSDDLLFLVGDQSVAVIPPAPTATEKSRRIKIVKQDIKAAAGTVQGFEATAAPVVVGRYAWWVGDEGMKASLALPDRAEEVKYAPWYDPNNPDRDEQRRRIHQQIGSLPNYFRADTATTLFAKEGFDPLASAGLLAKITTTSQFGLLTPAVGSMTGFARGHYHDFTTVARGVLANTRSDAYGGLLHDLSLNPDELGAAFSAYVDYTSYMETPGQTLAGSDPAYPEITDVDSPRRRYKITAPVVAAASSGLPDMVFSVAPVMTDFMLQFRFFHSAANKLTVRARLYAALWNPYTAALAPASTDALELDITGLPRVIVTDGTSGASTVVDLQAALPSPIRGSDGALKVGLPFGNTESTNGSQADRSSWLPGRVYGWTTESGSTPTGDLEFYNKTLNVTGWSYSAVSLAGVASSSLSVDTGGSDVPGLIIKLKSSAGVLATYTTPVFKAVDGVATASLPWQFGFATRLKQPLSGDADRTWLKTFDPRNVSLPAGGLGGFDPNQDITPLDPNVYASATSATTAYPQYLLYRVQGTSSLSLGSYNDAPLYELPRLPLLSVGELQHLQLKDTRPFAIGNSWGGSVNGMFDRYFFSGLPSTTTAAAGVPDLGAGQPLPNWNLQVTDTTDISVVRAEGALSAKHLLQAGAFNINSTSVAAWRAVLSSVRFPQAFAPADIENSGGSAFGTQKSSTGLGQEPFDADATLGSGVAAPVFLRFSQSAQETYFWKPVSSTTMTNRRELGTYAFRLGLRGSDNQTSAVSTVDGSVTAQRVTTDQIEELATQIVNLLKARAATKGSFRNLEEFLGPQNGAGTPSLLEAAISGTTINAPEVQPLDTMTTKMPDGLSYGAGFSALTLTQADIASALAPYLRARSDTFKIRSYGEAINPVTRQISGKAWLEATVQRVSATVDATDNIEKPTGSFGRRFKILSFQWLSPSDI